MSPFFSKGFEPVDVGKVMDMLRRAHKKYKGPPTTFERFAKPILGDDVYEKVSNIHWIS